MSHTSHLVTNIELDPAAREAGDWLVHSAFAVAEYRHTEQRWYAGRYSHRIRRIDGQLRIAQKKVVLVNCHAPHTAMAIYL